MELLISTSQETPRPIKRAVLESIAAVKAVGKVFNVDIDLLTSKNSVVCDNPQINASEAIKLVRAAIQPMGFLVHDKSKQGKAFILDCVKEGLMFSLEGKLEEGLIPAGKLTLHS